MDHLIRFVDRAVHEQFIDPTHRELMIVDDSPQGLLDKLDAWQPPPVDKVARAAQRIRGS